LILSGSAALANVQIASSDVTTTSTISSTTAPGSEIVNYSVRNYSNDFGNGTLMTPTVGVDYGVGPNLTGAVGQQAVQVDSGGQACFGALRGKSVGFPPHKNRYLMYDNNTSLALPAVR
ncbi:MAG: hypothetical protein ACRD3W_28830, partial [Terriglobales bacterium]